MKNKKLITLGAVALAIVLAVVLSGCSASGNPSATVTVTEQPTDSYNDTPVSTPEEDFLNAVYAKGNWVTENASDSSLLEAGWSTCDVFASGYTVDEVIAVLIGNNPSQDEAYAYGVIIGAAATTLCPEYAYLVSSYVGG